MLSITEKHSTALKWLGQQVFNREEPAVYFDPILELINPLWARRYLPARVESVEEETHDTLTFTLRPARRWGGFHPGQHLNIQIEKDGRWCSRPFTISSAPSLWAEHGLVTITVKRVPGGEVTPWLHERIDPGDVVGLTKAFGDEPNPQRDEPVLFIAGGSGITPALSQLQAMAEQGHEAPVTLLYFVRTSEDVIGAQSLRRLEQGMPQLSVTIVESEADPQAPEHLNATHLDAVPELAGRSCYLCGPPAMMDIAMELLAEAGVPDEQVHQTFFGPKSAPQMDVDGGGVVSFTRSGIEATNEDNRVLLEMAEDANLNPRYGCRMGICHQCSCRKTSGTVINRLTGVESSPGEETIQLCISVPRGAVEVDL